MMGVSGNYNYNAKFGGELVSIVSKNQCYKIVRCYKGILGSIAINFIKGQRIPLFGSVTCLKVTFCGLG